MTAFDELEVEPEDNELPLGQTWPESAIAAATPAPDGPVELTTLPVLHEAAKADILTFFGPPEHLTLAFPSSVNSGDPVWSSIELRLRKIQADRQLQNLREVIAEKSFLYSHVIRVAPRKAVRTRARTNIAKHNISIVHLCRSYMKTRAALFLLGETERSYPILLKEHVKASTAILDPNLPGASRLQLSWIWQVSGDRSSSTQSLLECT